MKTRQRIKSQRLRKASLPLLIALGLHCASPAFALRPQTGAEEINRELQKAGGLEETVYRRPPAAAAIPLNAPSSSVPTQVGSRFLLTDGRNYSVIRVDREGLSVLGREDLNLLDIGKPEQGVVLPGKVGIRETAVPGPGPDPGGKWQIPGFPWSVSQQEPGRLLLFEEAPSPPDQDKAQPAYLLFPLDRADLFDAALWYHHELSIRVLVALNDRDPTVPLQGLGDAIGDRPLTPREALQFLNRHPDAVLSLSSENPNLLSIQSRGPVSLAQLLLDARQLQARLAEFFPPPPAPQNIGVLAVIAAPDDQRRFYAAVAKEWAPLSTILPARSPAEANLIAQALGVKIDAVLLELDGMKEKNWSALYNQLGANIPAYFFGNAAVRETEPKKVKLLTDGVFYARHPIGGFLGLLPKLDQLNALVARDKTGLEEGAQRAQQALAFLAAFREDSAPHLAVLARAGLKTLDAEVAAVETYLRSAPPQIIPANYQLSLTVGSLLDNPRIPSAVKQAVSFPLIRAVGILSAPPAGAEERGAEILSPQPIEGNRIYALLQNYGFEKGLEVQFFRAGSAQGAPPAWSMVPQTGLTKFGFEARLAEVTRDYDAAGKPFSVAIYEAAAPPGEQPGIERIAQIRPVPPAGAEEAFEAAVRNYVSTLRIFKYTEAKLRQARSKEGEMFIGFSWSETEKIWADLHRMDGKNLSGAEIALAKIIRKVFSNEQETLEALRVVSPPMEILRHLEQVVRSAFTGVEEGVQEILLVSANEETQAAWSRLAQERGITIVLAPDLQEAADQLGVLQILHPADTRFGVVVDLSIDSFRRVLDFLARVNSPESEQGAVPVALLYSAVPAGIDLADLVDRKQVTVVSAGVGESAVPGIPEVLDRLNAAAGPTAGLEQLPVPVPLAPPVQAPPTQARGIGFVGDAGIALVMPEGVAQGTRYRIIAERSQQVRALVDAGIPAHNLIALVADAEEKQLVTALRVPETSIFSAADFGNDWNRLQQFAWEQAESSLKTFDQVDEVLVLRTPASARTPAELLAALEGILPPAWQKARPIRAEDARTILLVYELGV